MKQIRMAAVLAALVALLLGAGLSAKPVKPKGEKETPVVPPLKGKSETSKLFNGKNLDGWEGYKDHWSVENGVIVGKNTRPVPVSTYLLTKRKFSDFRLHAKVKQVKSKMHSGIAFWGEVLPEGGQYTKVRGKYTYGGHLVMFPFHWGMYDLFGRNGLPVDGGPAKKVGSDTEWNDVIILAQGNRVRVVVNGTLVVDWRDPEPKRIHKAPIGLQLHQNSVPQEVHFKDLVITTFPPDDDIPAKIGEKMKGAK
jgi:hypothetical protein